MVVKTFRGACIHCGDTFPHEPHWSVGSQFCPGVLGFGSRVLTAEFTKARAAYAVDSDVLKVTLPDDEA